MPHYSRLGLDRQTSGIDDGLSKGRRNYTTK
jgi:hypothetical protein